MNTTSVDLLTIVGINANIIGILVAVVAAVAVYYKQIIREAELQVIQEADNINSIVFERSSYYLEDSKSPWAQNIVKSLNREREKLSINKVKEAILSKYDIPISETDISELHRYLGFLSNPLDPIAGKDTDYAIGNEKYIPQDEANRGEEILIVMNYLSQADIFPESTFPSPAAYRKEPERRVYFSSIDDVKMWLAKADNFVTGIKQYNYIQTLLPRTRFIESLKSRDQQLIDKWKISPTLRSFGYLDPDYLLNDFRNKSELVRNVVDNTKHTYNKYQFLSKRYSLCPLFIMLVALLIVFIAGVAIPLLNNNIDRCIYVHLPVTVYILSFFGVLFWLFKK